MTLESVLTRRYYLTFIDARKIITEAKLSLDINGYPSPAQRSLIISEAEKIFEREYSPSQREHLRHRKFDLDSAKSDQGASDAESFLKFGEQSLGDMDFSVRSASQHNSMSFSDRSLGFFSKFKK